MKSEKVINLDLDDSRISKIGEVIGNKTCRKILELIAEREMSESEIADELKIPINTVGYNIKKLRESGLIEESKEILWSEKGKRVRKYGVSNKKIVISPRKANKLNLSLLGLAGVSGIAGLVMKFLGNKTYSAQDLSYATESTSLSVVESSREIAYKESVGAFGNLSFLDPAFFFISFAVILLIVVLIINWRKII